MWSEDGPLPMGGVSHAYFWCWQCINYTSRRGEFTIPVFDMPRGLPPCHIDLCKPSWQINFHANPLCHINFCKRPLGKSTLQTRLGSRLLKTAPFQKEGAIAETSFSYFPPFFCGPHQDSRIRYPPPSVHISLRNLYPLSFVKCKSPPPFHCRLSKRGWLQEGSRFHTHSPAFFFFAQHWVLGYQQPAPL